jgi:hypothetical protein
VVGADANPFTAATMEGNERIRNWIRIVIQRGSELFLPIRLGLEKVLREVSWWFVKKRLLKRALPRWTS